MLVYFWLKAALNRGPYPLDPSVYWQNEIQWGFIEPSGSRLFGSLLYYAGSHAIAQRSHFLYRTARIELC